MCVITPLIAGTIGTAALLGGGTAAAVSAMSQKPKTPDEIAKPDVPTVESAEDKAKKETEKKRKIIARTGGKTILASQYGGATDTATKTLLGQ